MLSSSVPQLMRRLGRRSVVLALFLTGASVQAEGKLPDGLQIHGFITQAYLLTTANNLFGDSVTGGSFDFRELGLNASWRATPRLQFSVQALSRLAGGTDDGAIRIDYGFVDYSFLSNTSVVAGLRLGRILNPLGFYNDTRDVAFLRPSILLPQSIYFDRSRNLALSADGLQLYGEHHGEIGDFSLQLQVAQPRVDDPDFERSIFGRSMPGRLEPELSWLGRLLYESNGGRVRLGVSGGQVQVGYNPAGFPDPLRSGTFSFEPLIFSAQYNARDWDLTAEYARRSGNFADFGRAIPDGGFTGESWYVQGVYRFSEQWEGVLRYDSFCFDREDRSGKAFEARTRGLVPAHSRFARDLTLGLRWLPTPSLMIRTEYHYVDGTGWLSELDNPGRRDMERYWSLFAVLVSYRF